MNIRFRVKKIISPNNSVHKFFIKAYVENDGDSFVACSDSSVAGLINLSEEEYRQIMIKNFKGEMFDEELVFSYMPLAEKAIDFLKQTCRLMGKC